MPSEDSDERLPDERAREWPDDEVHRVRVSERMLDELLTYGMTTTAGSSLVGPELLVLETVHDAEDGVGVGLTAAQRRLVETARKISEAPSGELTPLSEVETGDDAE